MNLQIKRNKHLFALCAETGISERVINDRVIGCLWAVAAIEEEPYYLGFTVRELLKKAYFEEEAFCIAVLGEETLSPLHLLNCSIVGSNEEGMCPDCGFDIEITNDGAFGFVWEEQKCLNDHCLYFSSTEPDLER